jgi:uncharacterized protein (TIGR03083 family)
MFMKTGVPVSAGRPRLLAVEYPDFLDAIRRESARFHAVLADCDPAARVPGCPEWDAADLLWHLTGVQRFWAGIVRFRPASPDDERIVQEGSGERPASYADLLAAFDEESASLVDALAVADPEEEAWHWSGDLRVGTTYRRQAHEALIHRVDAEQAAGVPLAPIDPALAEDGVAEVIGVMYGGEPPWGTATPTGETVGVRVTDTGRELLVAFRHFTGTDPDSGTAYDEEDLGLLDSGPEPSATVSGTAADLDLWLWKRGPADALEVEGDRISYEKMAGILAAPLN